MTISVYQTTAFNVLLLLSLTGFYSVQANTMTESVLVQENESQLTQDSWSQSINELASASLSKRGKVIERLAGFGDLRTLKVLQAMLKNRLFQIRSSGQVVIGKKTSTGYQCVVAEDENQLGIIEPSQLKTITVTNRIRSQLRVLIAMLQLNDNSAETRLQSVKTLSKKLDQSIYDKLQIRLAQEADKEVLNALQSTVALYELDHGETDTRLDALQRLKQYPSQDALNRIRHILDTDAEGQFLEADETMRRRAKSVITSIESRIQFYANLQTVFFGLSLGAVLVLAAIGLAITFGVMGVINMAHGELMMLGAYTTYVMQKILPDQLSMALLLSIPAAFLVSGLVGIIIERGVIRFLYGRPLETLLATFGVSLFLQQTVRSIFTPLNRSVSATDWMSGSLQINEFLSLTLNRLYILVFCLIVFALLLLILKRTRLGLEVRAVTQNRSMAKAMGIPTDRVDALTFGLGSGIAGVAGVALSQITNVGPNLGQSYIVDCFMVVVFGGVGNLWGTLVGGFTLGIANKVLEPHAGAVLAKILVLMFIILFIQKRPQGLFPQKGRAAEA